MVRASLALLGLAAGILASGCHRPPPTAVSYEPPLRIEDLGAGLNLHTNSFLLLTDETTTGTRAKTFARRPATFA